ncbi:anti-sigma factor [Aquincola sp. MAHUQ-54]|uniref:Anti-sigma factor n=1 Tax=Aquincola agrisoli TaxID=3119538 RepID=A0AAW9QBG9_9BURK
MIDLQDPEGRTAAAGEYVLGTLEPQDVAAFEAALAHDRPLLAEVYAWQDRLLSLSAQARPVLPGRQLWPRIEASLPAPAPARTTPTAAPARGVPWWQRLRLWQGVSLAAVAASLWMAVLLVERAPDADAGQRYVALLQSPGDQSTGWVVEVVEGRTVRLVPAADTGPVPAGRSLQFWTKPEGAAGPTSLGLVRAGQTLELPVSRLPPGLGPRQLFEITLEPENGSPLDRPTGPILYVGRTVGL